MMSFLSQWKRPRRTVTKGYVYDREMAGTLNVYFILLDYIHYSIANYLDLVLNIQYKTENYFRCIIQVSEDK